MTEDCWTLRHIRQSRSSLVSVNGDGQDGTALLDASQDRCGADVAAADTPHSASPWLPLASAVVLLVGDAAVRYECPVYIAQAASTLLQSLLADLVEHDTVTPSPSSSSIPLPFVAPATFDTIALYWEHFYGVAAVPSTVSPCTSSDPMPHRRPAALEPPLRFQALYHLSAWEQEFVLRRLVRLPTLLQQRCKQAASGEKDDLFETAMQTWLQDGAWVDALGMPASEADRRRARGDTAGVMAKMAYLTVAEKQIVMDELCRVLEACTRLGTAPLQSLCAALIADMLVDLAEDELLRVVTRPDAANTIPPFTSARRAALHAQFPWLATTDATAAGTEEDDAEGKLEEL